MFVHPDDARDRFAIATTGPFDPELHAPVSAGETFMAHFRATRFGELSDSYDRTVRPRAEKTLERLSEITGDRSIAPRKSGGLPAEVFIPGAATSSLVAGAANMTPAELETRLREQKQTIGLLRESHPELETYEDIVGDVGRELGDLEADRESIDRRAGFLATAAGFAGDVGAFFTDPINVATLPLGGTLARGTIKAALGRAGVGKLTAEVIERGVVQGGINAAIELPIQAEVGQFQRSLGREFGIGDALANVATAAVGGAFFEALGVAGRELLSRGSGSAVAKTAKAASPDVLPSSARAVEAPEVGRAAEDAAELLRAAVDEVRNTRLRSVDGLLLRAQQRVEAANSIASRLEDSIRVVRDKSGHVTHRIGPTPEADAAWQEVQRLVAHEEDVRGFAQRVREDGSLGDRGGRPFSTRKKAERFAETQPFLEGPFEVVPSGRGFGVRGTPDGTIRPLLGGRVADDALVATYRAAAERGLVHPTPRLMAAMDTLEQSQALARSRPGGIGARAHAASLQAANEELAAGRVAGGRSVDSPAEARAPSSPAEALEAPSTQTAPPYATEFGSDGHVPGFADVLEADPERQMTVTVTDKDNEPVTRTLKDLVDEDRRMRESLDALRSCALGTD